VDVLFALAVGEGDQAGVGELSPDFHHRGVSPLSRQAQVQQRHVGTVGAVQGCDLVAPARLRDDRDPGIAADHVAQAGADQRMVVRDQEADGRRLGHGVSNIIAIAGRACAAPSRSQRLLCC
jgi:hypothetical protein